MLRYQQADAAAATTLVDLLSPQLYRFFAASVGSRDDAADMLQEVWRRIHRLRHTYRPGRPLLPWVYAIARRVGQHQHREPPGAGREAATDAPSFGQIIASLPESQREALILLQVSGLSAENVARATSARPGDVKRKIHRAYEHLRGVPPFLNLSAAQRQLSVACREMDEVINSYPPGSERTSQARDHLAECERCRRLVGALDQIPGIPLPDPGQLQRIHTSLLGELKAVPPLAPPGAFVLGFTLIFVAVWIIGGLMTGQAGWHALATSRRIFVFGPVLASAGLLAFSVTGQMIPAGRHVSSTAVLAACVFLLLIPVIALLFQPRPESTFVQDGLACLRTGMSFAVPAAFLFGLLLRRGAILSPGLTGATAGGLAGLVGLAVLEVRCPDLDQYHILVWHLSVTLLSALAGLASGAIADYLYHRRAPA